MDPVMQDRLQPVPDRLKPVLHGSAYDVAFSSVDGSAGVAAACALAARLARSFSRRAVRLRLAIAARAFSPLILDMCDLRVRTVAWHDPPVEILCCTTRYRRLFGLPSSLPAADRSTTALGPWYANVLNLGPTRLLHFISSPSLLSVVITQRERKSAEERFVRGLRELLTELGVPANIIQAELDHLSSFQYARATDRSVLGSMRDQALGARFQYDHTSTLFELSHRLAQTPCGPRDYQSPARLAPALMKARWSSPRLLS